MSKILIPLMMTAAIVAVIALAAVTSPRCTPEVHNVKVGGMLVAGCER